MQKAPTTRPPMKILDGNLHSRCHVFLLLLNCCVNSKWQILWKEVMPRKNQGMVGGADTDDI
jgi:hypothetical protein